MPKLNEQAASLAARGNRAEGAYEQLAILSFVRSFVRQTELSKGQPDKTFS